MGINLSPQAALSPVGGAMLTRPADRKLANLHSFVSPAELWEKSSQSTSGLVNVPSRLSPLSPMFWNKHITYTFMRRQTYSHMIIDQQMIRNNENNKHVGPTII